jgi:glutamyl-tRNA synthetase
MTNKDKIANLIFPEIAETIADLEKKYPKRNLEEGAIVTRFAPSPTGFLHTGSLFTSLVSWRFAKQTNGVFFMRLEDTDQKREIKGSGEKVLEQLHIFGVAPDESYLEEGLYGPYVQSERKNIYHTVIKEMIIKGLAYPCFCTHDELAETRKYQEENKLLPGYYKEFAKCRKLSDEEVMEKISNGDNYVIRFKSNGDETSKADLYDAIRGHIQFPENMLDVVIMKSDLLPTYHFAHVVDDHFMHTTHVTRGEEWLPSVPIHLDIFAALGFELPIYCHFPVIMKLDDGKRRKLSKRKDSEASVDYFLEQGYPVEGFLEYLMTLANSNFEEWRLQNPHANIFDFPLTFDKMSIDGALFDLEKIKSISKDRLAYMNEETFALRCNKYAKKYNPELHELIVRRGFNYFRQVLENPDTESEHSDDDIQTISSDYFRSIINIERNQEKPRKDYEKFSDVLPIINFMYDDYYYSKDEGEEHWLNFDEKYLSKLNLVREILEEYKLNKGLDLSQEEWFANLKQMAIDRKFAARGKDFKKNPELYEGTVGDYAGILRMAICGRKNTPNFYSVLKILGDFRVDQRLDKAIAYLSHI